MFFFSPPPADGAENQRHLRGSEREETHEEGVTVHRIQLRQRWAFGYLKEQYAIFS